MHWLSAEFGNYLKWLLGLFHLRTHSQVIYGANNVILGKNLELLNLLYKQRLDFSARWLCCLNVCVLEKKGNGIFATLKSVLEELDPAKSPQIFMVKCCLSQLWQSRASFN